MKPNTQAINPANKQHQKLAKDMLLVAGMKTMLLPEVSTIAASYQTQTLQKPGDHNPLPKRRNQTQLLF